VTVADLVAAAAAGLSGLPPSVRVIAEPGRFAVADAAIGLTTVVARKQRDGFCWLVVDLATNTLVPIEGSWFPPVPLSVADGRPGAVFRLADQSCAVTEVHGAVRLPEDVSELAVLGAGAYTTSFAHVWGPPSARVAVLDQGRLDVLTSEDDQRLVARIMHGWQCDGQVPRLNA
jgi:diaminopimelate decarboxylase